MKLIIPSGVGELKWDKSYNRYVYIGYLISSIMPLNETLVHTPFPVLITQLIAFVLIVFQKKVQIALIRRLQLNSILRYVL